MRLTVFKNTVLLCVLIGISCGNISKSDDRRPKTDEHPLKTEDSQLETVVVGANRTELYLSLLKEKRVGIVANQTSVIFKDGRPMTDDGSYTHLVDSLLTLKVDV